MKLVCVYKRVHGVLPYECVRSHIVIKTAIFQLVGEECPPLKNYKGIWAGRVMSPSPTEMVRRRGGGKGRSADENWFKLRTPHPSARRCLGMIYNARCSQPPSPTGEGICWGGFSGRVMSSTLRVLHSHFTIKTVAYKLVGGHSVHPFINTN